MPGFLKQPLLHFLLLGALLFVVYQQRSTPATAEMGAPVDDNVIIVDRNALLDYMQYQAQAFEPAIFNERLNAMAPEEREQIIANYVREEALYREALRMHMDQGDYIIKQRLVQKVEFLLENLVADSVNPTEEQLAAFFAERHDEYRSAPVYSFTHIFFDKEKEGLETARQRATELLTASEAIAPADAAQYGDRFPFPQNYVERARDFVVNNFSADFVVELDKLQPSASQWRGPLESRYGIHLVMLVDRTEPVLPGLAEIRERVLDDYRYQVLVSDREAAEQEVVDGYEVRVNLDPAP
jgi:hypothetical protein